jgi:hypothetical protein
MTAAVPKEDRRALLMADLTHHFNDRFEFCMRDSAQRFTEAGLSAEDWYISIGAALLIRTAHFLRVGTKSSPEELGAVFVDTIKQGLKC